VPDYRVRIDRVRLVATSPDGSLAAWWGGELARLVAAELQAGGGSHRDLAGEQDPPRLAARAIAEAIRRHTAEQAE
jgi:hypothetical protein